MMIDIYHPQHSCNGNSLAEDLVVCPFRDVVNRLKEAKTKVEIFLGEVEEARKIEHSILSPVAGLLEKGELDFINKMLGLEK